MDEREDETGGAPAGAVGPRSFRKRQQDPSWRERLRRKLKRLAEEDPDTYPLF